MPILWVDIETTGINRMTDDILEIGAVMTDMSPELNELSQFHAVIRPQDGLDIMELDDAVWMMHSRNGLFDAIRDKKVSQPWGPVAATFESWVLAYAPLHEGSENLSIGGSVVDFDRDFLYRDFRWMKDVTTYWLYDTNPVRNFLKLIHGERNRPDPKSHRAMDDILDTIEEARWFLNREQRWLRTTG